jgi:transcriptional regulator with PAS, ATPase and Fis domain
MFKTMQIKLLRVLQERELSGVGGEDVIKINIRLITAYNKGLKKKIAKGGSSEQICFIV